MSTVRQTRRFVALIFSILTSHIVGECPDTDHFGYICCEFYFMIREEREKREEEDQCFLCIIIQYTSHVLHIGDGVTHSRIASVDTIQAGIVSHFVCIDCDT